MDIKNALLGIFMMMAGLGILLPGCSGGSDDGCDCDASPVIKKNGLDMRFEKQEEEEPANVSVLFKVETEDGVPVTDLESDDFRILEDGHAISPSESQQAILPKPGEFTSHTLLLLDLSGSVLKSDEGLDTLKEGAREFVYTMMPDPGDRHFGEIEMGVWWFDGASDIHPLVPFGTDTDRLISGINSIREDISEDSSTNLYGAIVEGIYRLEDMTDAEDTDVSVGSLVIFTDGRDQAARETRDRALRVAEDAGESVSVYSIGLQTEELDESALQAVGKNGSVFAENIDELVTKFGNIADDIRKDVNSYYLLEYCSPKREGEHELKISVTSGDMSASMTTCFCASDFGGGCRVYEE